MVSRVPIEHNTLRQRLARKYQVGTISPLRVNQDPTHMHDTTGMTTAAPRIRYWSAGDTGEKVLFVMGFGMRGDIWQSQILDLKTDHQVAWFDNRGIGESETTRQPFWTMKSFANDAIAVLNALEWSSCHLVGVSLGGMIAQEIALADQRRFKSLTLIATHDGGHLRKILHCPGCEVSSRPIYPPVINVSTQCANFCTPTNSRKWVTGLH